MLKVRTPILSRGQSLLPCQIFHNPRGKTFPGTIRILRSQGDQRSDDPGTLPPVLVVSRECKLGQVVAQNRPVLISACSRDKYFREVGESEKTWLIEPEAQRRKNGFDRQAATRVSFTSIPMA